MLLATEETVLSEFWPHRHAEVSAEPGVLNCGGNSLVRCSSVSPLGFAGGVFVVLGYGGWSIPFPPSLKLLGSTSVVLGGLPVFWSPSQASGLQCINTLHHAS